MMTAPQQLQPYGILGDIGRMVLPTVGQIAGRALGNEQIGATAGNIAGTVAGMLPFSAVPVQPQMQTYGVVGDLAGAIGAPAGRVIGNHFGYGQLGEQVGGTIGAVAKQFLPFSAAPQMTPYGVVGDLAGQYGGHVGQVIGNHFGHGQLGQQIGNTVGAIAQEFLPFSAMPQQAAQMTPYGIFGDIGRMVLPTVGQIAGRALGNEQIGRTAGNIAGTVAGMLPFSAVPGQPQMQTYGVVGDLAGAIGAPAGRVIGNHFGHGQLGEQVGGTIGAVAKQFLPFSAVPQAPVHAEPTHPVAPQMAPYGVGGAILGALAPAAGSAIGGLLGNKDLGRTIGSVAGTVLALSPFSAGPNGEVVYLPVHTTAVH